MIKRLLLLFLTVVFLGEARAQLFPAQATTQLTPPYSLFLADYVAPGSERLALNVFLRDISRPDINVRFRLRITGQGINIETKPEFIPPPVSLQGGVPLRLIGIDLAEYFEPRNLNFSGISQREYEQRGGLPEGLYQFSFEVLEYNRGVKISNTSSASAWLILNDPPIVNLPRDNDRIRPQDPQQVIFQWTPRHTGSPNAAFTTEYEFKLVEIWPATRNPNDAILTSPPIFETTTRSTTLVYGPAETPLELGRRYAFQIKAKSIVGVEELNLFKNGGKSQVYTFQYGDACYVPQSILAEPVGATRFKVAWDAASGHTSWKLRYRRDTANAAWFTKTSSLPTLEIGSLQPTTTYEYEVMAVCGSFESPYSPIASITTREAPVIAYSCGLPLEEFNLDPSQLIPELKKGDVIDAGDFDVKLQNVSGGNGIFSGEGFIEVPYFNQVKAKVVFENIKVNNDKRLVAGVMNVTGGGVEIVPEGVMDFMDQLSEVLDIADSALNIVDVFVQDNPPDPATFIADTLITVAGPLTVYPDLSNNGSVIVVDGNGNQQTLPPGTNYAITDDKGNGYLVDSKGQVTSTTAAQATASASREFNLTMKFEKASNSLYGLDNKTIAALARNYETLNNNYAVSWKAVAANSNEGVVAKLEDAGIDASRIKYELSGTEIVATTAGEPGKYLLNIIGKSAGTVDELIGRIPAAGENDKEQVLGKLNVVSYDKKPYNLVLVPVNHSDNNKTEYPHNIDQLKASLNKIYSQAVVDWTVRSEANLVVSGLSNTFDDGQSNAFSNYTEDMKKVINAFLTKHSFDEDTYYIFLLNKPKTVSKLGFMPRKKQAGFVFLDTHGGNESLLVKTIAHELAHGAFRLQHLWEEYSELKINTTDNLMDYTSGTTLVKFQWDLIHNPVAVLGLFEDDEEGAMAATDIEYFPDAATPCTTAQITKLQQDFEARLAGKKFRLYGGGMEMYGFDGYKLETGHKEILTKAGVCDLAQFDAKFKYVLNDPAHDIVRDLDVIYSTVNLWEGLQSGYNDGSVDWTSFVVPKITNQAELDNELNRLEAVTALAKETLPSGVVSETSYINIANYIKTCREQPTLALENKFHLNQTIKGIYVGLHCYANYTYSFSDLKVRPAIKASRLMWPDVEKAEQEGFAIPLSVSNTYSQYLAQYNTDKAYFLGEQYLANVFLIEMLRGMKDMFANLGTAWRTAINKQARLKMQVRRTELNALKGQVSRMQTSTTEKLWTEINEVDGDFQGKFATYYDVKVTYKSFSERAGVAFAENGTLEFHLNIPEQLQKQGIGTEIFKRAILEYSPIRVKGWWKQSDIYTGGESVNLKVFKEKVASGMKLLDAAFETPTGKILKDNGFNGVPEIIKNTPEEVIIHFNPKQ